MSKEIELKPYIVAPSEYDPELEVEVRKYTAEATPFKENKQLYKRTIPPKFLDDYEKDMWEREEIRRCREGHDGLPGKFYFYFNYTFIQKIEGGRIHPDFRVVDLEWFKFVEELQYGKDGWGIVCIKRRRVGASWKEAADMLHDTIFNAHTHVGMNSKSEADSIELFRKVRFAFDHLPSFLRPTVTSGKMDTLEFGISYIDNEGNKRTRGHQSYTVGRAPTVSAFEGFMLNKWICDEAGKIDKLLQMFAFTEDTMMDEFRRTGMPIVFGTVGEVDGKGGGIFELWDNAEAYRLKKFFFKGWMGLFVDKLGNDRVEESIRYIIYERKNQEKRGRKFYNDFLQRYPLSEDDAFAIAIDGGLGDPAKINQQRGILLTSPPPVKKGWYDWNSLMETGKPLFVPNKDGEVLIWEDPEPLRDAYPAGCDPVEAIPDPLPGASLLSFIMRRKQHGLRPATIVMEITYRPRDVSEFYQQVICALVDYNTRVLIERNRFDMISWFNRNGFKNLILPAPVGMTRITGGRQTTLGAAMTPATKIYMEGIIEAELMIGTDQIPSLMLLRELSVYGSRNTDRVMAFGWALMQEADMLRPARAAGDTDMFAGLTYEKVNGKLQRVKSFRKTNKEQLPDNVKKRGPGNYVMD